MERTTYRMELKKRRAEEISKSKRIIAIIIVLFIFIIFSLFVSLSVKATNISEDNITISKYNTQRVYSPEVYYTNHQVVKGSSLWNIASEVNTGLELSIVDTVKLLKEINSLNTDDLFEGQLIIVPYMKDISFYI